MFLLINEISNTLKIKLSKLQTKLRGHIKCFQIKLFLKFLIVVDYLLLGFLRPSIRKPGGNY